MMNYYNPYYQAYQPTQQVARVNGENGAKAYQLPPNSSALLLDESAPLVWLKQTDSNGFPSLTPYTITEYKPEPEVDLKAIMAKIEELEVRLNESDFTNHEKREPDNTTATRAKARKSAANLPADDAD